MLVQSSTKETDVFASFAPFHLILLMLLRATGPLVLAVIGVIPSSWIVPSIVLFLLATAFIPGVFNVF